jgi:hypothetical protein
MRASEINYLLSVDEILRQISGRDVPTIATLRISPMMNGVKPNSKVFAQVRSSEL